MIVNNIYFNVIYRNRVAAFTDNSGVSDVIRTSDEPPISSGIGATAPYILKAGDLIVIKNIVGIIESAIIDTAEGEFVITYSVTDTEINDLGVPEVGDEVICIQANEDLEEYDIIGSTSYYQETGYQILEYPKIPFVCEWGVESQKGVYSNSYIIYNSKETEFVNCIALNKKKFDLYGTVLQDNSFIYNKLFVASSCYVIADCNDVSSFAKRAAPMDESISFEQINKIVRPTHRFTVIS